MYVKLVACKDIPRKSLSHCLSLPVIPTWHTGGWGKTGVDLVPLLLPLSVPGSQAQPTAPLSHSSISGC